METDAPLPTVQELSQGYAAGDFDPTAITKQCLDRIHLLDGELHAFCLVDDERALADAADSLARHRVGRPRSSIDGVPVSIKDLFLTAGWPTRKGSIRVDATGPWTVDSPAAARLREAGAVLVGKTTTPEFGWKAVTDNPIDGITRNPLDPSLTAGGSSGGSAAALAAGMCALSVATDAAGSTRIPAAFCGVAGLKPTYGRIPLYPASDLGWLGCVGSMARTVADIAPLLDILARRDDRDPNAAPPPTESFADASVRPMAELRVAYSPTLGYVDVDPAVRMVVDNAVQSLRSYGVAVSQIDPPFHDPLETFTVLWSTGMLPLRDGVLGGSLEGIDKGLAELIELGAAYSVSDYLAARRAAQNLGTAMGGFHRDYDILLTPTVPIEPFAAGHDCPPGSGMSNWLEWTPFTLPFSLSQQPALSVPVGLTPNGLPVGLQVVGARHAESTVLAAGALIERIVAAVP